MRSFPGSARVLGVGRAGGAIALALQTVGWRVERWGRDRDPSGAAAGVDLLVLGVPDGVVLEVASTVEPASGCVVAHLSGVLGLGPLRTAGHQRPAVLHPLVSLPSPELGAQRLLDGAWFGLAAAGERLAAVVVDQLGGRAITVAETDWVRYHAAAVLASNHLVGLLGQVERIAAAVGAPLDAYLDLARGSLENVTTLGPRAALTGPVARDDWATVEAHLAALPDDEDRAAYQACVALCRRLL